jgi:hypothetical protein
MTNNWSISITYVVAGALGFEPRITGPKPVALPLGHAPIRSCLERPPAICARKSGGRCSQKYGELSPSYQHRVRRATHARTLLPCFLAASCRAVYIPGLFSQRSVAQPGSAPASGAGGREFESPHSDQSFAKSGLSSTGPNPCDRTYFAQKAMGELTLLKGGTATARALR